MSKQTKSASACFKDCRVKPNIIGHPLARKTRCLCTSKMARLRATGTYSTEKKKYTHEVRLKTLNPITHKDINNNDESQVGTFHCSSRVCRISLFLSHTHIYTYTYVCMHACMYVYIDTYLDTYIHIYIYIYIYMNMNMYI